MTTVAPAAQSILDQATALWPNRSRASDGTIGDAAHAARRSDHNPDSRGIVHAADLTHDPANGCDAHYWADQARQRAKAGREPRLKYVISNSRIASENSGWNWVGYDGSNPHTHHAHFSVNSGPIENDDSPWFVGADQGGLSVADIDKLIEKLERNRLSNIAQHQKDRQQARALAVREGRITKEAADEIVAAIEADD